MGIYIYIIILNIKFSAGPHPRLAALNYVIKRGPEFLLFGKQWELTGKMVRSRILLPCFHFPTREVSAVKSPTSILSRDATYYRFEP